MGYIMIQHLVKETKRRIGMLDLPYEDEYRAQLMHLGCKEKDIVKEAFLHQDWNVGSARVLSLLQECNVLSASEFMLSLNSIELMQQIMNDLLETEYHLLAHLVRYAYQDNVQSQLLTNILKECFRALLHDLKENPNVIPRNYLAAVKLHLLPTEMGKVTDEHLRLLLLQEDYDASALDEAIGKQVQWRDEMETLRGTVMAHLLLELVLDRANFIDLLTDCIRKLRPFSPKYALRLLHLMAETAVESGRTEDKLLKTFLKDLFRSVVATGSSSELKLLLLFAREITAANQTVLGSYATWYKQTFGEMTYSGVKKQQFITTMELLTALLPTERDLEVLNVHATVAISAPAKCNEHVLNYKQLCRAHIAQLKTAGSSSGGANVIVLDD
uniref:Fanconi_A_N domain-containing protein n=1 Tax=Anopheles stephensi TaxID=30069 RepID=A0A182Y296_ANOST